MALNSYKYKSKKLRVKLGIRDQEEQVYEGINDQRKSQSGR